MLPRAASRANLGRQASGSRITTASPVWFAATMIFVAALYLAREVLIPFFLSLLLCFLLAPMVSRLRRWGLGRIPAVAVTVLIASGVVGTVAYFVVVQLIDVTMRLPEYQSNIEQKIESLRVKSDGKLDRAMRMFTHLNETMDSANKEPTPGEGPVSPGANSTTAQQKPEAFEFVEPALTPIAIFRNVLGTAMGPLAMAGIVFVLVIFMLIEREALRNRLIRAVGTAPGQLNTTTQALDDAARRVSRYLLMQLIVNVAYGIPIGIGLYFIGVPNAALWGLLATVLRFIPYVGPFIAGFFPMALAFAIDPGWSMVIQTLLLFAMIEFVSNNFIETRLYGTSVGISSVAILLSALFWGWLWGPVGLLMSMPLTVCLVVLGRYIPALNGLSLLLGDQPGLPLYARMYQRFLAMDPDEPDLIAREYLADHTVEELFGHVLVPTLRLLEDERHHESLEPVRRAFILEHIRELIEDVADHSDTAPVAVPSADETSRPNLSDVTSVPPVMASSAHITESPPIGSSLPGPVAVVCMPAHDESDEIVGLMIAVLLRRRGVRASTISADQSSAERIRRLEDDGASIACVSVLPPYAVVYARHTVQRIHARFPRMKIVVGFWEASVASTDLTNQLVAVGATEVLSSVRQVVESLLAHAAAESTSSTMMTEGLLGMKT